MGKFEKRVPRGTTELRDILSNILKKLDDLNDRYDNGEEEYYPEIALKIRMLVHDTKNQVSLLSKLGIKKQIQYLDSAGEFCEENLLTTNNLTVMRIGSDVPASYLPKLSVPGSDYSSFDVWWDRVVICDSQRRRISRKDLILEVADTDQGAHVDEVKEYYHNLSKENSLGWKSLIDGASIPLNNPVPASVRQVSYELIESLKLEKPYDPA